MYLEETFNTLGRGRFSRGELSYQHGKDLNIHPLSATLGSLASSRARPTFFCTDSSRSRQVPPSGILLLVGGEPLQSVDDVAVDGYNCQPVRERAPPECHARGGVGRMRAPRRKQAACEPGP